MEQEPKNEAPGPEEDFVALEKKLLSQEINLKNFLDQIEELDQSDPERKSSIRAVALLSKPNISAIFEESPVRSDFYSLRSLSYFHKAQILLSGGVVDGIADFRKALQDAEEVDFEFYEEWVSYVRATIAYLENDIEEVEKNIKDIESKNNKALVQNFINGLKERGFPDYIVDYSMERS